MANAIFPQPFDAGFRLIGGEKLSNAISQDIVSSQDGITAFAGGGSTNATPLVAVMNRVTVVASTNDSVKLPASTPGLSCTIDNDSANILQVYAAGTDQIEDSASPISIPASADTTFVSPAAGKWYQLGTSGAFTGAFNGTVGATTPNTGAFTAIQGPAPVAGGTTIAVTAANANAPILLNTAAGTTATLPAATGSGNVYKFFVSTTATSNAHKILANSVSDFLNGNATGHVSAGTTLTFSAAAATAHSIQMPFAGTQPSGGFIGDWFEFTDVAANLWMVKGTYQAGTTATTPFSVATT